MDINELITIVKNKLLNQIPMPYFVLQAIAFEVYLPISL